MAQYSSSKTNTTVTVTGGSANVIGNGTLWLSNVKVGDAFTVQNTNVVYDVANIVSDTELNLSVPYRGDTATQVAYTIHRDFTTPDNIPELTNGDIETGTIMKRLARTIQTRFNSPSEVSALSAANIYSSITNGLNDTVSGEYFFVSGTDSYKLYLNDSGVEAEKFTFPSVSEIEQAILDAQNSADSANVSESNALESENKAEDWAIENEGVPVEEDPNANTWMASTSYLLGDLVIPSTKNGYYYEVTTEGISGSTEPAWPTTVGATVSDDFVVWTTRANFSAKHYSIKSSDNADSSKVSENKAKDWAIENEGVPVEEDPNANTWLALVNYSLGDLVTPSTKNGYYYEVVKAGTSGSTEPTWPTTVNTEISDDSIIWVTRANFSAKHYAIKAGGLVENVYEDNPTNEVHIVKGVDRLVLGFGDQRIEIDQNGVTITAKEINLVEVQ